MSIRFELKGSFKNTDRFFSKMKTKWVRHILEKYGEEGVQALSNATPKLTGTTSRSWSYEIVEYGHSYKLAWTNSAKGSDGKIPIVILLIYGHGTRNGGYVQPNDFVNPEIDKIFKKIADEAWLEVSKS